MINYLDKSNALQEERNDDDKAIVFSYTIDDILSLCYEVSQNMASLLVTEGGLTLIDEYSMDESKPSDEMKKSFISKVWSDISRLLLKVYDDTLKDYHYIEDTEFSIPVINNSICDTSVLKVVDDAIRDVAVYSVVSSWYTLTNNEKLKAMSLTDYNDAFSKLLGAVKKMETSLLRKQLKSAIFDSMI